MVGLPIPQYFGGVNEHDADVFGGGGQAVAVFKLGKAKLFHSGERSFVGKQGDGLPTAVSVDVNSIRGDFYYLLFFFYIKYSTGLVDCQDVFLMYEPTESSNKNQ